MDEVLGLITSSLMLFPINNYLYLKTQFFTTISYNSLKTENSSIVSDNPKTKD